MKRLTSDDLKTIGYKIKLYPDTDQKVLLRRYFGASRFVYNLGINLQEEQYKRYEEGLETFSTLSYFNLVKIYTELKNTKFLWLNEFSSSLSLVFKDVCIAYDKFFRGICNHPKYHKKKFNHQMFPIRSDRLYIYEDYIKVSSIGVLKCDKHTHSEIIGTGNKDKQNIIYKHYYNTRILFDGFNYWLAFNLEINNDENINSNSCKMFLNNDIWLNKNYSDPIGIDLGCKKNNWIVDSNGNRISNPDCSKEEKRIKKYHRKFIHKKEMNDKIMGKKHNSTVTQNVKRGFYTKNEEKMLKKLNKAYKRINNKRKTLIHQYACSIIAEKPSCIVMEDLSVKSMLYSKEDSEISYIHRQRHNKKIYDSMLYEIRTIIENKANNNNIPFLLADKEFPSTQLCSKCGYRQKIGIKTIYKCPCCKNEIDRDFNAALNLSNLAFTNYNYALA